MASHTREQAVQIGRVRLGDRPRLVLAVGGLHPMLRRPLPRGVDFIEARVDLFARLDPDQVARTVADLRRHGRPLIGTVRSHLEGGKARLDDSERAELYARIMPLVAAVDIELRAAHALRQSIDLARAQRRRVILSVHDFAKTPPARALESFFEKAKAAGADIVKIAAQAQNQEDVLRLLQFTLDHRRDRVVTMAMGPLGSVSRLLLPLAGSLLTYTNLKPAHGQIPLRRLLDDLRFYFPAPPRR